ncbi:Spy/CpxP family protein refolding chaperone [Methylophaga sp.]|uniref:Spy/CpxP family protein refolding chaperone n=1 Tax=Methylophaga sp. TaxID=2024840 RepID=UPI003A95D6DD
MRNKLMMVSLIPALFLAAPAMADEHKSCEVGGKYSEMNKKHKEHDGIPRMLKSIDLTDAQKAEIKTLVEAQHKDKKSTMKSHWQTHKQLAELSFAETVDQSKLDAIIADTTAAHEKRLADRAQLNNQIFKLLTPEQQQQLQQKIAEYEQKMQDRKKL